MIDYKCMILVGGIMHCTITDSSTYFMMVNKNGDSYGTELKPFASGQFMLLHFNPQIN